MFCKAAVVAGWPPPLAYRQARLHGLRRGKLAFFRHRLAKCLNAAYGVVPRQNFRFGLAPEFELHFALFQGALAHGQPDRQSDQIGIAEFFARPCGAVVVKHFKARLQQALIMLFGLLTYCRVLQV